MAATTLRFERRRSERRQAQGTAVAVFGRKDRAPLLTSVRLADWSREGLGVYLDSEIRPGTNFALYPEDGSMARRFGRVARCERVGKGFRLGLQYQQALAA